MNSAFVLAASAAAVLVALAWLDRRLARRDRLKARLTQACRPSAEADGFRRTAGALLGRGRGLLDLLAGRFAALPLVGSRDQAKMRVLLAAAGFRENAALSRYVTGKIMAMALGVSGGLALAYDRDIGGGHPLLPAGLAVIAAFAAGLAVELSLKWLARRRRTQIRMALADALDLMIIAANAGNSLDVALARVGRELERAAPALADEFAVTTSEMRVLPNRRQALENLADRTGMREVRSLTATLIQTIRYGTPLTQSLKALALEMRQAKLLALEEHAARLPALLSIPLMLLIMPSIFIVTAGPAVVRIGIALFQ